MPARAEDVSGSSFSVAAAAARPAGRLRPAAAARTRALASARRWRPPSIVHGAREGSAARGRRSPVPAPRRSVPWGRDTPGAARRYERRPLRRARLRAPSTRGAVCRRCCRVVRRAARLADSRSPDRFADGAGRWRGSAVPRYSRVRRPRRRDGRQWAGPPRARSRPVAAPYAEPLGVRPGSARPVVRRRTRASGRRCSRASATAVEGVRDTAGCTHARRCATATRYRIDRAPARRRCEALPEVLAPARGTRAPAANWRPTAGCGTSRPRRPRLQAPRRRWRCASSCGRPRCRRTCSTG